MLSHITASEARRPTGGPYTLRARRWSVKLDQRGFTLVELLISLVLTSLLFSSMLVVFQAQTRINTVETEVGESQQNARVAMTALNQDIRQAGFFVDQFNRQPVWIDAAPYQLIFNANLSAQFVAMHRDSTVPLSDGTMYRPGDYSSPPQEENLPAHLIRYLNESETIRFTLDTNYDGLITAEDRRGGTFNPNIFILQKEINGNPPAILAYNIRGPLPYPDGTMPAPLFKYWGTFVSDDQFDLWGDTNDDGEISPAEASALTRVPVAQLHNIRQVDVEIMVETSRPDNRYRGTGSTETTPYPYRAYNLRGRIRARNVGINPGGLVLCGNPPSSPLNPTGYDTPFDQGGSITLEWDSSAEEYSGEEDVQYYTIYRRLGAGDFEVVGQLQGMGIDTTYVFADDGDIDNFNAPVDGEEYYYLFAAWDCAPQESEPSAVIGPLVSMPNGAAPPHIEDGWDTACDGGQDITVQFSRSPQDEGTPTGVVKYNIYRGTTMDSSIVSKILVDTLSAVGSSLYEYHDTVGNWAGVPPVDSLPYYYIIRAVQGGIESDNSNEYGAVWSDIGLSAPRLLSVEDKPADDGTALILNWRRSASEDCDTAPHKYRVRRRVKGISEWYNVEDVPVTFQEYYEFEDDNGGAGLVTGTTYEYIIVVMTTGEGEDSNIMEGTPIANPLIGAPSHLVADDVPCDADGDIQLSWTASYDDGGGSYIVDEYWIYRKIDGGAYSLVYQLPAAEMGSYEWTDNDITNPGNEPILGNTYWYKVTAYDTGTGSESDPTNEDDAISDGTPGAPTITAAYDTYGEGSREVRLEFTASADDGGCSDSVTRYYIYRTTNPDSGYVMIGMTTAIDAESYVWEDNATNSSPPPGEETTYYYMIRAYDVINDIESMDSNEFGPVDPSGAGCVCCPILSDDFESGNMGWTSGGTRDDWQLGVPRGKSSDPSLAYSGASVWGNDLGDGSLDGQYRARANNYLISPTMDFSGFTEGYVILSYYRWLTVEDSNKDKAQVRVNVGSGWETVWQNIQSDDTVDSGWKLQYIDLSQQVLGQSSVQIAFTLETNASQQFGGWNIDDFLVCYTAPSPCDYFIYVGDSVAQNQGNNLFFDITNAAVEAVDMLGMEVGWSAEGSLLKRIRTQGSGPGLVWTGIPAQPTVVVAMFDTPVPFAVDETIRFKLVYQPGQLRGSALTLRFLTECGWSKEIVIMIPM